jgi:hypothetical protein
MGMTDSLLKPVVMSRWLDWQPRARMTEDSAGSERTKPSKPGSEGFVGSSQPVSPNNETGTRGKTVGRDPRMVETSLNPGPSKPTKPPITDLTVLSPRPIPAVLQALPAGVRLVRYDPKTPPIGIDICTVVIDLEKFLETELHELNARLHSPIQIRGGWGVFTILARLRQAGLDLEIATGNTP